MESIQKNMSNGVYETPLHVQIRKYTEAKNHMVPHINTQMISISVNS